MTPVMLMSQTLEPLTLLDTTRHKALIFPSFPFHGMLHVVNGPHDMAVYSGEATEQDVDVAQEDWAAT